MLRKLAKFLVFLLLAYVIVRAAKKLLAPADTASGPMPDQATDPYDEAPLGGDISPDLLDILVCPDDKGALELVDEGKFLLNPRKGYKYPIRAGVPVMLIEEGRKHMDASFVANGSTAE